MKKLFRLYRRSNGIYYSENSLSRKQQSLRTREEEVARILIDAKNEAARQPMLNRLIGLTYLSASTPEAGTPVVGTSVVAGAMVWDPLVGGGSWSTGLVGCGPGSGR